MSGYEAGADRWVPEGGDEPVLSGSEKWVSWALVGMEASPRRACRLGLPPGSSCAWTGRGPLLGGARGGPTRGPGQSQAPSAARDAARGRALTERQSRGPGQGGNLVPREALWRLLGRLRGGGTRRPSDVRARGSLGIRSLLGSLRGAFLSPNGPRASGLPRPVVSSGHF